MTFKYQISMSHTHTPLLTLCCSICASSEKRKEGEIEDGGGHVYVQSSTFLLQSLGDSRQLCWKRWPWQRDCCFLVSRTNKCWTEVSADRWFILTLIGGKTLIKLLAQSEHIWCILLNLGDSNIYLLFLPACLLNHYGNCLGYTNMIIFLIF